MSGDIERARVRYKVTKYAQFSQNTKTLLKQTKKLISSGELVKIANAHELGIG